MLFLDGNTYSMDFSHFDPASPLPNTVYSCHDYAMMGFPRGGNYVGTEEQKGKLRSSFERKVAFMRAAKVPIWNGEFGPVYASQAHPEGSEETPEVINERRFAMLRQQLPIYRETEVSWSIWLYMDIGYQGMVHVDPNSAYMQLIAPFLAKKVRLSLDFWGSTDEHVAHIYGPFLGALKEMVPEHLHMRRYPSPLWTIERQFDRTIREGLLSEYLVWEMAELFKNKTEAELDALAGCFRIENCVLREGLNAILKEDAEKDPIV